MAVVVVVVSILLLSLLAVNAPESSPPPTPPTHSPTVHPLDRELNFDNTVTVFLPSPDASRDDEQVRVGARMRIPIIAHQNIDGANKPKIIF